MNTISAVGDPVKSNMSRRTQLTREQFMSILINEMKNQNPFNPMNNTDFVNQIIGLQNLEGSTKLIDSLTQFQSFMKLSSASSFIGKIVAAKDESGQTITGVVKSAKIEDGNVFLNVNGKRLPVENIVEVLGGIETLFG